MTKLPNILVTGTPGTGKTTTASLISSALNLRHIDLSTLIKEQNLHSGYDKEYDSYIIDEDKVVDYLDPILSEGGVCLDHHGSDFFPIRWFQLVVVLNCKTELLWDRLLDRGYREEKISENVQCEIMRVCYEEAVEGWGEEGCLEMRSESCEDMEKNVERVEKWFEEYTGGL